MMGQDETNLAGEEVSIYDGDTLVGNAPVVDGRWQYTVPSLALGGHDFNARVGPLTSDRWSLARVPPFEDFTDFEGGNLNGWWSYLDNRWAWEGHADTQQGSVGKLTRIADGEWITLLKSFAAPAVGRYRFQASLKGSHAGMTVNVGWSSSELVGNFQIVAGQWRMFSVEVPVEREEENPLFRWKVKGVVGNSLLIDNISITRIG
ncbi:hypothetical protein BWR59_19005 [Pseudomonas sp. Bc-h]|nr:hypothetical protein BWR59_19005 [Pseudomonas sp. Bc-h]